MSTFILNWQDPADRRWYPVARLIRGEEAYLFAYTNGALRSPRFVPFGNMTDLRAVYASFELFPIFANRVMSERRPEFERYAAWSGMVGSFSADPLLLMATMGGSRATDTLQVYPVPEMTPDGRYHSVFFVHGISHLPDASQHRVFALQGGDKLYPMLDIHNAFDARAIALRTDDPTTLVGYLPRYLAQDAQTLATNPQNKFQLTIKQINFDAPPQYRLLCQADSSWPWGFVPCNQEEYTTIMSFDVDSILKSLPVEIETHSNWRRGDLFK